MPFISSFPKLAPFPLAGNASSGVRHQVKRCCQSLTCRSRCEVVYNKVPCGNYFPQFDVQGSLHTHATQMYVKAAQTAQGNTNLLTSKAHHVWPVRITNSTIMYCLPA